VDEVLVTLRCELEQARRAGVDFPDAWEPAVQHALALAPKGPQRKTWEVALSGTRRAWSRCYAGARPSRLEALADMVARDD
jgi:hypothetical protein